MRFVAAACLAGAVLAAGPTLAEEAKRPNKVSFYFAAHEDDWQLFMNPSAFQDVIGGAAKTVFVHLTAGDAGLGTGLGGRKHPFYLARENGAEAAIRFMADADGTPGERIAAPMMFNGHAVYRVSYRNTVGYFLRVPDGNASGAGYSATGFQSLKGLAGGENDTLRAVDGSTTYYGWNDLVATLRAIIVYERGRAPLVQVNVAERNRYAYQSERSRRPSDDGKGRTRCRHQFFMRAPGLLRGLCQFTAAAKSGCATARHGKLSVCGNACRHSGPRSSDVMASL